MEKVPKTSTTKYMKEISDVVDEGRQLFKRFSMMMTWPKFLPRRKKIGSQNTSNVSPKARTSCNQTLRIQRRHADVSEDTINVFHFFCLPFLFCFVELPK